MLVPGAAGWEAFLSILCFIWFGFLMFLLPGENLLGDSLKGHVRSVLLSIEEVNSTRKESTKWEVSVPYAL